MNRINCLTRFSFFNKFSFHGHRIRVRLFVAFDFTIGIPRSAVNRAHNQKACRRWCEPFEFCMRRLTARGRRNSPQV